jgi:hypothetical protein
MAVVRQSQMIELRRERPAFLDDAATRKTDPE